MHVSLFTEPTKSVQRVGLLSVWMPGRTQGGTPQSMSPRTRGHSTVHDVETADHSLTDVAERTMPEEVADLDIEVQAMFDRIRTRLGLQPTPRDERETVGRYELEDQKIGAGGMGSVYRAYDTELRRMVAIKLVSPRSLTKVHKLRDRLRREAVVLARLDHPNVVKVYDGGVDRGRVFLAMELVVGDTLREWQTRPECSVKERLRLYADAGRGLAAAHRAGIVHRDFKPDNVFVGEDGRARVGDFGLAYVLGEHDVEHGEDSSDGSAVSEQITQAGEFLGTIGYSAPEQLSGNRPDARSDQYAFFVALWESLCGEKPYAGSTRAELLDAMQQGEPRGAAALPSRLRRILRVGLSVQPERRYSHMEAVVAVLERELERPRRILRRTGWTMTIVVCLAGPLWYVARTASHECQLADEIAAQSSTKAWSEFAEALPEVAVRFKALLDEREAEARLMCLSGDRARARRQQLEAIVRILERLPGYPLSEFPGFAQELEHALVAGPTAALTPTIDLFVAETIEPREAEGEHAKVIEACNTALEAARTAADRAELHLRRGRAYSQHGEYQLAVLDFKEARRLAELAGDRERRLRANLEAAKTLVMRSEQLEQAAVWLDIARDVLEAVGEPMTSPRRADLDEVSASRLRRLEDFDSALVLQRKAVTRDMLAGRSYTLVPRLINLGHIHEARGHAFAAERCYRIALGLDGDDPEVLVNLARLLVNEFQPTDDRDEVRRILDAILDSDHRDTLLLAAIAALQLEIQLGDVDNIRSRRERLLDLLESGHPGTPTHIREAWQMIAYSHGVAGDLDHRFDSTLETLRPMLSAGDQAWFDLDLVEAVGWSHPEIVVKLLDHASSQLGHPDSAPERDELSARIEAARHGRN
jgi:tetratricopeptide (TPR) repeat protein